MDSEQLSTLLSVYLMNKFSGSFNFIKEMHTAKSNNALINKWQKFTKDKAKHWLKYSIKMKFG